MQRTTARAALLVGSAFAAPLAVVGVANALSSPDPSPDVPHPAQRGDVAARGPRPVELTAEQQAATEASEAFFANGYQFCDAEALADATGVEPWEAKVAVGARLLGGEAVDPPSGCDDAVDSDSAALLAFFDAGYRFCDAEAVAGALGIDTYEAKVQVGAAVAAGEPVDPPRDCA